MTTTDEAKQGDAPTEGEFQKFGLSEAVMRGVEAAGFTVPSPIQLQAIPVILEGKDLIGQAHTGTGKTAAFGLPALNRLKNNGSVEVLVITPTRELATQVSEEISRLGRYVNVRSIPVYGGQPYTRQLESIRRGAQVVVATPGRLLDLLQGGKIRDAFKPWMVVIDEADEMLDMGFIEDVQKILEFLPEERQTLLFSATMPGPVQQLAEKFMKSPTVIRADHREPTSSDIEQQYYIIDEHERDDATMRLIDSLEPSRGIIFCRTKGEVDRLAGMLTGRGVQAQALHGDMEQPMRERVLKAFRKGDFLILVATDVAARGLDVPDISHVFNYHIPFDTDAYVHRIGRTGRAGRKGMAVTLVTPREYYGLRRIQSKVGRMQLSLVPTHKEMQKAADAKLLEAIRTQVVDSDIEHFVMALEEELGLADAVNKMAALLLSREEVTGPDQIGLSGARLERLQSPPSRPAYGGRDRRPSYGAGGRDRAPFKKRFGRSGDESSAGRERPAYKKRTTEGGERSGSEERPAYKKRATPYGSGEDRPAYKKKAVPRPAEDRPFFTKKSEAVGSGDERPAYKKKAPSRDFSEERPAYKKRTSTYGAGDERPPYKNRTTYGSGSGEDRPVFKKKAGARAKFEPSEAAFGYKKKVSSRAKFEPAGSESGYGYKKKAAVGAKPKKRGASKSGAPEWVPKKFRKG